jgi:predicted sulfurtransferase
MVPPPTSKSSRSGVKSHITKKINQLKTYESVTMTLKTSNELDDLKQNLKKSFESFQQLSIKIQDELNTVDAPKKNTRQKMNIPKMPKRKFMLQEQF